jgi:hypothetical protein
LILSSPLGEGKGGGLVHQTYVAGCSTQSPSGVQP